jgi:hypothetical protein
LAAERIHLVIAGDLVLGAYRAADSAELHRRCITGAAVVACDLLDSVPPGVVDDLAAEWDADPDDDTPVTEISLQDVDDSP